MGKWVKQAAREVRDNLERYLNYPLTHQVCIGDYGIYNGRQCSFDWKGNLADYGIRIPTTGLRPVVAESYSTGHAVDLETKVDVTTKKPVASVSFRKNGAMVLQACRMTVESADTAQLEAELKEAINRRGLEWNFKRVIVTDVWHAEGFTQLVSGGTTAGIVIEASAIGVAPGLELFADPTVELSVTSHKSMSYHTIGHGSTQPYFNIHSLRLSSNGSITLERYAEQSFLFSLAS